MNYNTRSDSWMGKSLIFLVVVIIFLTGMAVLGMTNAPKKAAEAAGMNADVHRKEAELAADMPGMPGVAAVKQEYEIYHIKAQWEQEMRDRAIFQQAQDEQMRLTQALNNQQIARGEERLAREVKIGEYVINLVAFAGVILVLVAAYATKRLIDRKLPTPPRPVAVQTVVGQPTRRAVRQGQPLHEQPRPRPVIIEVDAASVRRHVPTYSTNGNGYSANGNGHSANGNSHSTNGNSHSTNGNSHSTNGNSHSINGNSHSTNGYGFIGRPTGQPVRER